MKKFIIVVIAALGLAATAMAQPRALGVRVTYGAEISYQHNLGSNFLEADLGLFGNGFYLTGVYDFIFANEGDFNFYAGPGAQLGLASYTNEEGNKSLACGAGVVGQVGAEYNFASIPLQMSLDWRPCFSITGGGFGWQGFALGIRYRF